jgi:tetratricopeptide (TPR) repeat protein
LGGCGNAADGVSLPNIAVSGTSEVFRERLRQAEAAVRANPMSANDWASLATVYHANGFDAAAVAAYRAALERSPADSGKLHYLLALACEASGDAAGAEEALEQSLRKTPVYIPAQLRLAELHYKTGRAARAIERYRAVLEFETDQPEALLAIAREALRRGDHANALASLEQLGRSHPEYGSALSLHAQLLDRLGRKDEAESLRRRGRVRKDPSMHDPHVEEMMRACVDVARLSIRFEDSLNAGRLDEALANLDRIESIAPDDWLPHRMRGFAFAHSGRLEDAVAAYRRAIELGGDPTATYPGWVAALTKLGRSEGAERAAREGLSKAPRHGPLLVMLAELRLKGGDTTEAEALLKQALAADDRDLAALRALARLTWDSGRAAEALTHAKRLVQLDPLDVGARVLLAQHELGASRPGNAIQPLTEAAAAEPANAEVARLLALAWIRAGNEHARERRLDEAIEHYERALAIDPLSEEARTNRARVTDYRRRMSTRPSGGDAR